MNFRIINRKHVSHILHELRGGRHHVTLLTVHGPSYNAFHAQSHPLRYECKTVAICLKEMKKLDAYLRSGKNLGLKLRGSVIVRIIYYDDPAK